jgi:hypothetical protein
LTERVALKNLFRKFKGKEPLGGPSHKWKRNIKMGFKKNRVDWIHLAWDIIQWQALVDIVISFWVPQNISTFLSV